MTGTLSITSLETLVTLYPEQVAFSLPLDPQHLVVFLLAQWYLPGLCIIIIWEHSESTDFLVL